MITFDKLKSNYEKTYLANYEKYHLAAARGCAVVVLQ
jgi:hypothetical protein